MKYLAYFVIFVEIGFVACADSRAEKEGTLETNSVNITIAVGNEEKPPINAVRNDFPDFKNFKYPKFCLESDKEPFLLKDGVFKDKKGGGEMIFTGVDYADVTGDGKEEALVVLGIRTGGTGSENCVYIFSFENRAKQKVKLLWDFQTGDRADGGLRRLYGQNGTFVLEKYLPEDNWGSCCSKYYKRETYRWDGNKFKKEQEEKLDNPSGRADMEVGG